MTMDDLAKQLLREFSKLRAEVRDNGIVVEQMRDELRAVHEAVGGIQEQLADVPKRDEFDELRRDVKATMSALRDASGQVADHETRITALEAA
jgi:hypothetical protein